MGYTHYWKETAFTDGQWQLFIDAEHRLIHEAVFNANIKLDREWDNDSEPPEVTDELVAFNGRADAGHETFFFERENNQFNFCKTARKPYDDVVVASLIMAHYFDPEFTWSSDGNFDDGDFNAGLDLATQILGVEITDIGIVTDDDEEW